VRRRWSNLSGGWGTVEVGIGGGVDDFDVFDGLGGALVAGGFEFFFAFVPVGVFVD